ncbi:SPOR domain-containing protein [Wohlfahrtiimonas larvae]|uniref:SPOR domain-containing protein n=1 Tax=Wohlfahrtiimonas larvae TaxID=1157986 RepID=A0ABP9MLL9_9GAMM|nr:SPOR domain-containing protein [Wohlfahrtiimonas larvae]
MNKKLQQRIVGSIAVLALLILILPHLLSSNEYKVPKPSQTSENKSQIATTNPFDDFQAPTISVDPIPTLSNDGQSTPANVDPISESTWDNVTNQENTSPLIPTQPQRDPNLSVAEQLLAEANHQAPNSAQKNDQTKTSNQLPKIELIGTTQSKPNTKPQTPVAAQPKFTWYVQVGSYSSKENANKAMMEYKKRGYASEVAYLSGQYKVRIGPLKTQENAKNVQADLKRQGQNSYIIQIQ